MAGFAFDGAGSPGWVTRGCDDLLKCPTHHGAPVSVETSRQVMIGQKHSSFKKKSFINFRWGRDWIRTGLAFSDRVSFVGTTRFHEQNYDWYPFDWLFSFNRHTLRASTLEAVCLFMAVPSLEGNAVWNEYIGLLSARDIYNRSPLTQQTNEQMVQTMSMRVEDSRATQEREWCNAMS
jgi:hypothetical protein